MQSRTSVSVASPFDIMLKFETNAIVTCEQTLKIPYIQSFIILVSSLYVLSDIKYMLRQTGISHNQ